MDIKKKILLVDDNPHNLQVIGNAIKSEEYELVFAMNGEMALKIVNENVFDLILLDISMPGINGYEVCRKLKNDKKLSEIPVIFMTAHTQPEDIVKGFEAGGVDYITKPFNTKELIQRVRTQIEIHSQRIQLKMQNKELSELNATKNKFFSIISHDLKSPFGGIHELLGILKDNLERFNSSEIKELINTLYVSASNGYKLLENLLEWSRLQTGRIQFKKENFDLMEVINSNIEINLQKANEKEINLNSKVQSPINITADKQMISAVIRNLITNALKFTNRNGNVIINCTCDNDKIEVSVEDDGVGINPEQIDKIFKIEENFTSVGTEKEEGTGLGLILCKEFIDLHKGKITIQSELSKGTNITFTIPQ